MGETRPWGDLKTVGDQKTVAALLPPFGCMTGMVSECSRECVCLEETPERHGDTCSYRGAACSVAGAVGLIGLVSPNERVPRLRVSPKYGRARVPALAQASLAFEVADLSFGPVEPRRGLRAG